MAGRVEPTVSRAKRPVLGRLGAAAAKVPAGDLEVGEVRQLGAPGVGRANGITLSGNSLLADFLTS